MSVFIIKCLPNVQNMSTDKESAFRKSPQTENVFHNFNSEKVIIFQKIKTTNGVLTKRKKIEIIESLQYTRNYSNIKCLIALIA